ncbi:DEAD/DEAH box helicase [Pectinatus frisingensis]|uniref:DEAD/DEAH box helicase n=1 Tax=Pectinatus frisingensis TaxID=865 RepID=UPI0015F64098|nr:DEAD/DEAH box helicase [Pectinatus frisingensis]
MTFGDITLSKKVIDALNDMGFEEPSPIQSKTIPLVMEGDDVLGQAQTGTGKTAAFGIPTVEKIDETNRHIQALVIAPTRELAIQVAEELNKIGKYKRIKTLPIYGGQMIERQIRALKNGIKIIVGTPGRLLDHINRKTIKLDHIKTLILDEADEMLDMGFIDDIQSIMSHIPKENRQTLLFSATMPAPIEKLAQGYMNSPKKVLISKGHLTVPLIDQIYYETRDKFDGLSRILDVEGTGKFIIFCRTKRGVDDLIASLEARGYMAGGLHGDMNQAQRQRVMKKFRDGKLDILIATDVAARGIDIDDITHVINYDIPQDPESYVHRIGRTGRAGRSGIAITFIEPREYSQLRLIEKLIKHRMIRGQLPTSADVLELQKESIKKKLIKVLQANNYSDYHMIVADLVADKYDSLDIAAAAVKLSVEGLKEHEQSNNDNSTQEKFSNSGGAPGMVRLFVNIGRNQKIRPEDIVRFIATEADIPGNIIGVINIYDKFTFVEVPGSVAERVISVMHRNTLKGYKINVEPARGRN